MAESNLCTSSSSLRSCSPCRKILTTDNICVVINWGIGLCEWVSCILIYSYLSAFTWTQVSRNSSAPSSACSLVNLMYVLMLSMCWMKILANLFKMFHTCYSGGDIAVPLVCWNSLCTQRRWCQEITFISILSQVIEKNSLHKNWATPSTEEHHEMKI